MDRLCTGDFSLLPPHIITQILRYLKLDDFKIASSVCKSWYHASTDPQIVKNLILEPSEENFPEICKSNRRYGVLKLKFLEFDKEDNYYFELFEKFGPFIHELRILNSELEMHHLLKFFEFTTRLNVFSFRECPRLVELLGLFPLDYDCDAKNRIIQNLSGVKKIVIKKCINIPFIADLLRYAINLDTFEFNNKFLQFDELDGNPYHHFFTIFDNDNVGKLTHLNLQCNFDACADDFITSFIQINNFKLKSARIVIWWIWEGSVCQSSLFRQMILKLQGLEELCIYGFMVEDLLSIICEHMANLKSLDCLLANDQAISQLAILKKLEILRCRFSQDCNRRVNFIEIDKFFKCKFEYLRVFKFEEFVTERNLVQFCENHPNLVELKLSILFTPNLEPICKHLTKLRVLSIRFRFVLLMATDLVREYEWKISRLQDLEEFYLSELVSGICEVDVNQLKKLESTNVPTLFRNKSKRRISK